MFLCQVNWLTFCGSGKLLVVTLNFTPGSVHKWGVDDYSWVFNKCRTLPKVGLAMWEMSCRHWNKLKLKLDFTVPANRYYAMRLPVWSP